MCVQTEALMHCGVQRRWTGAVAPDLPNVSTETLADYMRSIYTLLDHKRNECKLDASEFKLLLNNFPSEMRPVVRWMATKMAG